MAEHHTLADARKALEEAIERAVYDAIDDYGHPQAVDTVGDAVTEIMAAVGDYLAAEWGERVLAQAQRRLSERDPREQHYPGPDVKEFLARRGQTPADRLGPSISDIIRRKAEEGNGPDWKDYQ